MRHSRRRLYSHRWEAARLVHLRQHPLCVYCQQAGRLTPATVVDHIIPHRGDLALFWDAGNWQSLCKRCHDTTKQAEERADPHRGCDADGLPVDPGHHWR